MSENKVRAIEALNMWREGGSISTQCVLDIIIKAVKEEVPGWTFSAEIKPDEPQLIQGYTAENWQEIIDGGYLCEFSHGDQYNHSFLGRLYDCNKRENDECHYFTREKYQTNEYEFCRPAQIKGVMRPIFVEPVDDVVWCSFFGENSHLGDERWGVRQHTGHFPTATKYIEL